MKVLVSVIALALVAAPALGDELAVGSVGKFELAKPGGEPVSLAGLLAKEGTQVVVVAITSYTCPYSLRADAELPPVLEKYGAKGVTFVGIYPNGHETEEGIAAHAKKEGFTHLLLKDPAGDVARAFGTDVTPTFYVFDKGAVLRYRGSLKGLAPALDAVLAGETVETPTTTTTGCTVKFPERQPTPPTPPPPDRPDGPRLSDTAAAWLDQLAKHLGSDDPIVRRSAAAGIEALGPGALPRLERLRRGAEGFLAVELDRLMRRLRAGPGPAPAGERPPAAAPGRRRFGLENTKRFLVERLGLTEEQQAELAKAFAPLEEKERELRKKIEEGDRESVREEFRSLREEVRKAIEGVLTEEQMARYEEMRRRGRRGGGRNRPGGGRDR